MQSILKNYTQSRMSPFDEYALRKLLNGKKNLAILEIGSWLGAGSTRIFADYASEIVCIDHWEGNENPEHQAIKQESDPYQIFRANTKDISDRIIAIRADSSRSLQLLRDNYFDFIFIDGDHRYAQTSADIKALRNKINPNSGILAGHDCEGRLRDLQPYFSDSDYSKDHIDSPIGKFKHVHPGVILAVDEEFGGSVKLFADDNHKITLNNGRKGHSTIWYFSAST